MKERIEIKDLLQYKYPENLQYNPDGKLLAFQVGSADEKKNEYHRDVWMIKDGKAVQMTASLNTTFVAWNSETQMIVARRLDGDEPGCTHLFLLDAGGGEAKAWITLPFVMQKFIKVSEGVYAALGLSDAKDPDAWRDSAEERRCKADVRKAEAEYQVIEEVPYWHNGSGFSNCERATLFLVNTKAQLFIKRLTSPWFDVGEMLVENGIIYYTGNTWKRRASVFSKVYAYHMNTGKNEALYSRTDRHINSLFCLHGQLYASVSDLKEFGIEETGRICCLQKGSFTPGMNPERSLHCSVAGDTMLGGGRESAVSGDAWYTVASDEDRSEIWKYSSQFVKTVLFSQPGAVFFMDACKDRIAFAYESPAALTEIYEMNLDGSHAVKVTNLNGNVLNNKYVALPRRIDYDSHELKLHGWVLLPQNFSRKKKYPAVLDIHGGPRAIYSEAFFHEMQVWAAQGYVVFFTNIFGSDGRGDAFADLRGRYGAIDYDNLMDFTDAVLKKYSNIDAEKLCETGGSYGGFMTNWIIGHTDRFCAAASQRSIANWTSMTFLSDIGLYFCPDQCGTGLFGDYKKYWNCSPLKYADHVKTPTLFIHSDEDYRCPLPEGMQMMQALAVRNVETKMVIFHGENHELSRSGKPLHRIRRLKEITDWFNAHTCQK